MLKKERRPDPRKIRTRQLLHDAFMELIPELGYEAITVKQITDRATLNRATFYLHYDDKQQLLSHIINQVLEDLGNTPPIPTADPPDESAIRQIFIHLFDHVARHAAFYRVMLREPSVASYLHQLQNYIQEIGMRMLISTGTATSSDQLLPPDLFIAFVSWAYLGVIDWWVTNNMPCSSERMAVQFMRLALGGTQNEFRIKEMIASLENELLTRNF